MANTGDAATSGSRKMGPNPLFRILMFSIDPLLANSPVKRKLGREQASCSQLLLPRPQTSDPQTQFTTIPGPMPNAFFEVFRSLRVACTSGQSRREWPSLPSVPSAGDGSNVMDAPSHFAASRAGGIAAQLRRASTANHHHPCLESVGPVDTSTGFERQEGGSDRWNCDWANCWWKAAC